MSRNFSANWDLVWTMPLPLRHLARWRLRGTVARCSLWRSPFFVFWRIAIRSARTMGGHGPVWTHAGGRFSRHPPMRCITHGKHSSTRRAGWTGRSTRGFGRTRLIRSDCSPPRDARRWHAAAAILWTSLVLANRVGIGAAGILPRSWLLALTRALPPPFRELIVPRLTRNSSLFGGTRERPDDVAMVVAVWVCAFCCWVQRAVPWMAASLGRLTVGPER